MKVFLISFIVAFVCAFVAHCWIVLNMYLYGQSSLSIIPLTLINGYLIKEAFFRKKVVNDF